MADATTSVAALFSICSTAVYKAANLCHKQVVKQMAENSVAEMLNGLVNISHKTNKTWYECPATRQQPLGNHDEITQKQPPITQSGRRETIVKNVDAILRSSGY
ncbi:hypothetical protein JR316_0008547 [Psilocybe cubensis]|uniref:Uncharacterized protein n=1 Tax=Psilocybe cubensis TaxID=181762 RepID=A0ACB8GW36_PSICU|nr:hypothetical protein JR316_0008547 [Psilocybe cubensis]KAH9479950.1 hypothetical protein JR316_0008547 [Psilocybe cubensis]